MHIYVIDVMHIYIYIYKIRRHMFFIHLSTDGHLGRFCVLAIVSNAAVNAGMHILFTSLSPCLWIHTQK